jgi:hypothetical protein
LTMRMSRILPVIHLIFAMILLKWGEYYAHPAWWVRGMYSSFWVPTAVLVCYGINAPAYRLVPALNTLVLGRFIPKIAGFFPEEQLLLVGVVVLWYLVGKEIDAWRRPEEFSFAKPGAGKMVRNGIVLLYGMLLLVTMNFHDTDNNRLGDLIERILWFVWALILIFLPARKLLIMVRRKPSNQTLDPRQAGGS